jgi:oligopeptide transport system substrate-binding protein
VRISARDEPTLIITLANPTEHFNRILCHHAFAAVHPSGVAGRVFSGPFVLAENSSDRIRIEKNENYWGAQDVALPSITVRFSDDYDENAYQMNIGNADWAASVNSSKLLDQRIIKFYGEFATEYFFFKADRFPWNDSDFRTALITAVPWDKLRSQALVPARTFIYSLHGYDPPDGFSDYDIAEAKILLKQARQNAQMTENAPLTITIAISNSDYMKSQAEVLKTAWEEIGIIVEVQTTPPSRYIQSIGSWQADLFTYTWIGDFADPVAFLVLFRGDSSLNITAWKDAHFDSLLQKANACTDASERFGILAEAEELLLNSGAVLPVSHPVSVNVIDTNAVGGWYVNALDIHPYKYLYFTGRIQAIPNLVIR